MNSNYYIEELSKRVFELEKRLTYLENLLLGKTKEK